MGAARICFATDYLPNYHKNWGGGEQAAYNLLRLLTRNGYQLTALSKRPLKGPEEDFDLSTVPVIEDFFPGRLKSLVQEAKSVVFPFDPLAFVFSYRILRKIKPAVLHLHNIRSLSLSLILAAKGLGIPVVFSAYDFWYVCPLGTLVKEGARCTKFQGFQCVSCIKSRRKIGFLQGLLLALPLRKKIFDYFLNRIDAFIFLSDAWAQIFGQYGVEKEKIAIVPLPLPEEGRPETGQCQVEEGSILFVGWIHPHKGLRVLIRAIPQIMREVPGVKLRIIETGVDEDYKREIMNLIEKYDLEQSVSFLGKRTNEDVQAFIRKAEVVVVPEQWGIAWPIFLTEAMSHGKPIVASRIGDIPQFIKDGENGLLEHPENDLGFAQKIVWMFQEKEAAAKMGKKAREDVIRICDENRISNELGKVYRKHTKKNIEKRRSRDIRNAEAG